VIKKIQVELTLLVILFVNIFLSYNVDIKVYNYFFNLNYGFQSEYLKKFFVGITELGNSLWYFFFILFVLLLSFICKKMKIISQQTNAYLNVLSFFSLGYMVLVGLATQTLKHVVGRPRPNHADFDNGLNFNFFSTDASFHSFPSGHSSTIISVSLILGLLIPSLRFFFLVAGFVVALSRVVVGAHFASDIVAGCLIALISFKIFLLLLSKYYPDTKTNSFEIKKVSAFLKTNIIFLTIGLFITLGYAFDVYLSGLFYAENRFYLQSYDLVSVFFRKILLPLLVVYVFILPSLSKKKIVQKIFFGYSFSVKETLFILISGFITHIVFVNILLKKMWGRTRPNDVLQFGGDGYFMPWYKIGDSCVSNCSFVSGDASIGFGLVVFYFITKNNIFIYLSVLLGLGLGFVRIIAGGHFLSDVIFSQILVTFSLLAAYTAYKRILNE
tara:strand:+ start:1069 stop:2394 length:1326 start_codon:yes stop_codon:yes gene_type:complete